MSKLKPYPEYKDSGVEWIGDVPEEWETIKIKYLVTQPESLFIDGDWIESDVIIETGIRYLTTGNIGPGYYREQGRGFISKKTFEKLNCLRAFPGDIAISRLNEPIGRCCILPNHEDYYVVAVDIVILRPDKKYDKRFLMYSMNTKRYSENGAIAARGTTMSRVSRTALGNFRIPITDINTQQRIASYLDDKVSQIDSLIADKKRLIELLEEKRQAVITETVTKGLDPNVKMKDSGIEWIGEIPEHWEVKRIKYLFEERNDRNFEDNKKLLSLYTDIGVRPRAEMIERGNKAQTIQNYKIVRKKDIVVNKLLAWMGAIGISGYNGVTSPDYDVYRSINENKVNSLYYHYYFRNHYFKGDCYKYGRGIMLMRWRTYSEEFKRIRVLLPPIEEQRDIINRIHQYSELIIDSKNSILKQISKLKEYRESLIYEAVTGKIDLRNYEIAQTEL